MLRLTAALLVTILCGHAVVGWSTDMQCTPATTNLLFIAKKVVASCYEEETCRVPTDCNCALAADNPTWQTDDSLQELVGEGGENNNNGGVTVIAHPTEAGMAGLVDATSSDHYGTTVPYVGGGGPGLVQIAFRSGFEKVLTNLTIGLLATECDPARSFGLQILSKEKGGNRIYMILQISATPKDNSPQPHVQPTSQVQVWTVNFRQAPPVELLVIRVTDRSGAANGAQIAELDLNFISEDEVWPIPPPPTVEEMEAAEAAKQAALNLAQINMQGELGNVIGGPPEPLPADLAAQQAQQQAQQQQQAENNNNNSGGFSDSDRSSVAQGLTIGALLGIFIAVCGVGCVMCSRKRGGHSGRGWGSMRSHYHGSRGEQILSRMTNTFNSLHKKNSRPWDRRPEQSKHRESYALVGRGDDTMEVDVDADLGLDDD